MSHERIIKFLKEADGYVSGEEMSVLLKISRAAVWKHIDQLRHEGYEINAVPHLGYRLDQTPDKLIAREIQFGLKTKVLGHKIISFDSVASTMDEAFRLGMDHAPEGTVVCAETQSKGRGRLGRGWVSPKGKGIYCSIILRPPFAPDQMAQLTLMSAVAVTEAIEEATGVKAGIKWPNDLLVGSKKLAGILTELRAEMDQVKFVVIGIGINANALVKELVPEATSLKIESGMTINRVALLQEMLRSLEKWYGKLKQGHFDVVIAHWKKYSSTLSKRVRVTDPGGIVEGIAVDLDKDGGLLIKLDSGRIIKKMAGDVLQLR